MAVHWLFLSLLFFLLALGLLVITIPHITAVYSPIVKLLLTTLPPPPSRSVNTRNKKMESLVSIAALTRKEHEMAIPSEFKQHQRRRVAIPKKNRFN